MLLDLVSSCQKGYESESFKAFFENKIDKINRLEDENLRFEGLFGLIRVLLYNYKDRIKNDERRAFTYFLFRFADSPKLLSKTDPVTLFYDLQNLISAHFDLSELDPAKTYDVADMESFGFVEKFKDYFESRDLPNKQKDYHLKRHSYADLIYTKGKNAELFRSSAATQQNHDEFEPFYYASRVLNEHGKEIWVWQLSIPANFLETVLRKALDSYLRYCKENDITPYAEFSDIQKLMLSWYEE